MEILAAYDLTESYRDAAALAGCDHHMVARYVAARDSGRLSDAPARRAQAIAAYREKLEGGGEVSRWRGGAGGAPGETLGRGEPGPWRGGAGGGGAALRATIATCVPADPQSKGGSEATVRIAAADLLRFAERLALSS